MSRPPGGGCRRYADPALTDRLAADYVLGLMSEGARRRYERIERLDSGWLRARTRWTGLLQPLPRSLPVEAPAPRVWAEIERRIDQGASRATAPVAARDASAIGRGEASRAIRPRRGAASEAEPRGTRAASTLVGAVLAALIVLVGGAAAMVRIAGSGPLDLVHADSLTVLGGKPGWSALVVVHGSRVGVRPIGPWPRASGLRYVLWVVPSQGERRAIGVVDPQRPSVLSLGAGHDEALDARQGFAISWEPVDGQTGRSADPDPAIVLVGDEIQVALARGDPR